MRWLLLFACLLAPQLAHAEEPLRLAPTTDWLLDYAEERCTLHRGFGERDNALTLRIDWYGPRSSSRVLLIGASVPELSQVMTRLTHRFTPDSQDRESSGLNGHAGDLPAVSFSTRFLPYDQVLDEESRSYTEALERAAAIRPPQPDFERQVRSLEIKFANGKAIDLALGSMAQPLAAVRSCLDNLETAWGLDPAQQASLTRLAVPKVSTVRRVQSRYPARMVRAGTNAFVPVRLMIDAKGKPSDCVVQAEVIDEEFKDAVCDGLAKGYEPALDAQGNPVASVYHTSVIYMLN